MSNHTEKRIKDGRPQAMKGYCHKCGSETETVYLQLSSGHIGNCCAICRTCRRFNPYVSKRKVAAILKQNPMLLKGFTNNETQTI